MTLFIKRALLALLLFSFMTVANATAQETVLLEIKGTPGRILHFQVSLGGNLKFDLDSLPLPNSKMSGENLIAEVVFDAYFDTIDADEDATSYAAKVLLDEILLGGLMQLPDAGGSSPEIKLDITPRGGIESVEITNFEIPGGGMDMIKNMIPGMEGMGMDTSSLDTILPMIVGLMPPIFPEDPVAVGDKWAMKASEEDMPMPIFPLLEFRYKLMSVEDGVAKIKFRSKGDYDGAFLNNFLSMIPEIPMGSDEMSVDKINLLIDWDIDGSLEYLIAEGNIKTLTAKGTINIEGGGKLSFTHEDGTIDSWEPSLTATLGLNASLVYVGDVERAAFNELFPLPLQEDDSASEEATQSDEVAPTAESE